MGILTNNVNETGKQILEIQAYVLQNINAITFSIAQLETQLNAMKINDEFIQEDIYEVIQLIIDIKTKLRDI